jgi:hypothetical protein
MCRQRPHAWQNFPSPLRASNPLKFNRSIVQSGHRNHPNNPLSCGGSATRSTSSSFGWAQLSRGSDGRFGLRRFRAKLTPTPFGTHRAFTHALSPSLALRSAAQVKKETGRRRRGPKSDSSISPLPWTSWRSAIWGLRRFHLFSSPTQQCHPFMIPPVEACSPKVTHACRLRSGKRFGPAERIAEEFFVVSGGSNPRRRS